MTEPYLIAHKVRGEPAFDIAINIGDETGDLWIIPTSGHRAYPYWSTPLNEIGICKTEYWEDSQTLNDAVPPMPEGYPDHYQINKPSKPTPLIGAEELDDILADIDELKPISEQRGD